MSIYPSSHIVPLSEFLFCKFVYNYMKKKLELYFTRDFALCTNDFWHYLLAVEFKKEFGIGITKQIMRFNGRAIEAYRDISEMDEVRDYILAKGLDNQIFSKENVEKFRADINDTEELNKRVKGADLQTMIDNFPESVRLWKSFYPYVAFSNFLPSRWKEKLFAMYPEQAEEMADRWYKARLFSEGKFEMMDYYWRDLIGKFLEKHNLNKSLCTLVRFKELKEMVNGKFSLDMKELMDRKKGYILYKNNFMLNKDFAEFLDENGFVYDDLNLDTNIDGFKGQVASQGEIVKGSVQIILNIDEAKIFKKDNILITSMTVPDFLPAMKKAKAIITDEGGLTCHAVIVSRELSIPCIIGTRIATKVLKNGDLIEIDANKGIIKILKRNN